MFLALAVPSLFAPLAGHLADRVRRKALLIAVNAVTALVVLSLLAVRSSDDLWIIYAVVGEGLHRPASFMGVVLSVQGVGAIVSGLTAAYLMRRFGAARTVGLALACFAIGTVFYRTSTLPLVLAGAVLDGLGVVWLSVGLFTAMQEHTPPRLQGRVNAAATTVLITPQTVSIAAGAALISVVSYRLMLLVVAAVIGACAAWLLARPAGLPQKRGQEVPINGRGRLGLRAKTRVGCWGRRAAPSPAGGIWCRLTRRALRSSRATA